MTDNIIDIDIMDLDGNHYHINSIRRSGNDALLLIIKPVEDEYVSDDNLNTGTYWK